MVYIKNKVVKRSHTFRQRRPVVCGPSGGGVLSPPHPHLSAGTKLLFASCRSFFHSLSLSHDSIFSLHSTVDCQRFGAVVCVFEASAKLIQSRGGALWLALRLQDVGRLSHCVIKLSRNCSRWPDRAAIAQRSHRLAALQRLYRRGNTPARPRMFRTAIRRDAKVVPQPSVSCTLFCSSHQASW